ncbi:hypothetical protein KIPB_016465, partial [Kipferlia bialata]|eukprot:g16465.t1
MGELEMAVTSYIAAAPTLRGCQLHGSLQGIRADALGTMRK